MGRIPWKVWTAAFVTVVIVIATITHLLFDVNAVGSTMRFLWSGLVLALLSLARLMEAAIILVTRRRAIKITQAVTSVGVGYASSVFLSDEQLKKVRAEHKRLRGTLSALANRWRELSLVTKLVIVAIIITSQVVLIPALAAYIVLFPVGFMIPYVIALGKTIARFVGGKFADTYVSRAYWRLFGKLHKRIASHQTLMRTWQKVCGPFLLARLQYLTAWRMWRHAECYKKRHLGRRRISLYEPLRLWWRKELNMYVGRPLLSGRSAVWPKSTYVPPLLWYEKTESDWAPIVQFALIILATVVCLELLTESRVIQNAYHDLTLRFKR